MPVRSPSLSFTVLAASDFDDDEIKSWIGGRYGAKMDRKKGAANGDGKLQDYGNRNIKTVPRANGLPKQQSVVGNGIPTSGPISDPLSMPINRVSAKNCTQQSKQIATNDVVVINGASSEKESDKKRKKRRHRSRRGSMADNINSNIAMMPVAGSGDGTAAESMVNESVDGPLLLSRLSSSSSPANGEGDVAAMAGRLLEGCRSSAISRSEETAFEVDEEMAPSSSVITTITNELVVEKSNQASQPGNGMGDMGGFDGDEAISLETAMECQNISLVMGEDGVVDAPNLDTSMTGVRRLGGMLDMADVCSQEAGSGIVADDGRENVNVEGNGYGGNSVSSNDDLQPNQVERVSSLEKIEIRADDGDGAMIDDTEGRAIDGEREGDEKRESSSSEERLVMNREGDMAEDFAGRSTCFNREKRVDGKKSMVSSYRLDVKPLQGFRMEEAMAAGPSPRRRRVGNSVEGTPRAGTYGEDVMLEEDSLVAQTMGTSPFRFLIDEIMGGSALRNTASPNGNMKRERVYNTMFHVPWRVELLIDVGFLVCLDAFLYLFTVMPIRILLFLWRRLRFQWPQRPHPDEICDFVSLIVLVLGVYSLHQADISFIYHWIRGQAIIKLYVVFNVLEIIDKLCQSFGGDVMQMLFNTAAGVAHCPTERLWVESLRLTFDLCIAIVCYLLHSLIILSQAVTLNVAINSHSNALLTLLISNNFMEIKGNVFKRLGRENLHKMAYLDTVERFHISAHILFVLVQNLFVAEEPWLMDLASNAGMILLCEVLVDAIKHAFLAKFNDIKPRVYGEFLQSLCRQTLHSQSRHVHKTLTFVPLAPACVVARVMGALFYEIMPNSPDWWKWTGRSLGLVFIFLVLLFMKIILALGLQWHARWYLRKTLKTQDSSLHWD